MKIITGNPGTGKHTIAKIVARKLGLDLVDINRVAIEEGAVEKHMQTLNVDTKKLKKHIGKKIRKNSLLVGHLAPYVISKNIVDVAVVLRRNPYKLLKVYERRGYSKRKAIENAGSEILGIIYYDSIKNFGADKTFQLDTSNNSINDTVKKAESFFLNKKIKQDNVDWLNLVLRKGDLKRFFPY